MAGIRWQIGNAVYHNLVIEPRIRRELRPPSGRQTGIVGSESPRHRPFEHQNSALRLLAFCRNSTCGWLIYHHDGGGGLDFGKFPFCLQNWSSLCLPVVETIRL
jgi:hypothetical protein